jgi:hypothetical protein
MKALRGNQNPVTGAGSRVLLQRMEEEINRGRLTESIYPLGAHLLSE